MINTIMFLDILDDITFKETKYNSLLCNTCTTEITTLTDNLNYCFMCDKFFYTNFMSNKVLNYNITVSQFDNKVIHLTTIINTIFKDKNVLDKVLIVENELISRNMDIKDVGIDDIYTIIKLKNLKTYNAATEIYSYMKNKNKPSGICYISNDIINIVEAFFVKLFNYVYETKKTNYTINYSFFLERILTFIGVDIGFKPKILKNNKKIIENSHLWDGFLRHIESTATDLEHIGQNNHKD